MIDYPIFISLWVIVLLFMYLNRSADVNGPDHIFKEKDDLVYFKDVPIRRIFNLPGKIIEKTDVNKIVYSTGRLQLITGQYGPVDVWVPKKVFNAVLARSFELFPNAEHVCQD